MSGLLITWCRLFDGRLWHIAERPDVTWCGKSLDATDARRPERIDGCPPGNGWVCDRCVRAVHDLAAIAAAVWRSDPRRRTGDTLPAPDSDGDGAGDNPPNPIPAADPDPDPEPAAPVVVDLVGALKASVEAAQKRRRPPDAIDELVGEIRAGLADREHVEPDVVRLTHFHTPTTNQEA